ncbi:hypothetical protein BDQ12DRAFT_749688 [Crucibulum laeve]|uniref:Uncharacterized protein n=1 Tax=Crucibulum laeve TaxID=68775 RepID=A0A5C3LZL6_9AGAR|nr:hypothetical protein BDQ12DRAFT_749688 [Crucibulum laeve]
MLLIFLSPAFLGRELGARGAPVNGQLSSTTLIPGISESIEAGCPDIGNLRSGWDILWSCLATIFACTWIALHPNIQARKDGWYKVALRRLKICFYALMAPEMILSWALRQWLGARHISRKYQSRGWTLSHGFFVQMGGFMLVEGEKPARTLTYEEFEALYESGKIEFPTISENEIQDRSKSDMISKSLVVIQTSWFILQTVTRIIQHLPIAELELITLSFALLNGVMYFLWWRKPLDNAAAN